MRKVNTKEVPEETWSSPKGKFCGAGKHLLLYVVADNPIGESNHFPDSDKWIVRSPERKIVHAGEQDYYQGEE